jgi:cytochrome P450
VPEEPVDLQGATIPAFTPVLVMLAAANRDPTQFAEPDRFDIERQGEPAPLSFAVGLHHCLGAALARMEAEVMLECVALRWPQLTLVDPAPKWWGVGPFRGLDQLRVAPRPSKPNTAPREPPAPIKGP